MKVQPLPLEVKDGVEEQEGEDVEEHYDGVLDDAHVDTGSCLSLFRFQTSNGPRIRHSGEGRFPTEDGKRPQTPRVSGSVGWGRNPRYGGRVKWGPRPRMERMVQT